MSENPLLRFVHLMGRIKMQPALERRGKGPLGLEQMTPLTLQGSSPSSVNPLVVN
jgi:hypothetical protein